MIKNRFAGVIQNDSDDEFIDQKKTKTQKKKDENKISEKPVKINHSQMAEEGFEVITNQSVTTQKTAEGGVKFERGPRGGRGGARGGAYDNQVNKPRSDRPRAAIVTDVDGNQVTEKPRKERQPFRGKDGDHPFERHSGTGKSIKPLIKKNGHGKGNWGDKPDLLFKQKEGEVLVIYDTPVVEEMKAEKEKVPEPEPEYEIIGVSLDDFKKQSSITQKKEARAAEGIKDDKIEESKVAKERVMTQTQKTYLKDVLAKKADESTSILGFGSVPEDEDVFARGEKGRGGKGRGGAQQYTGAKQGARKQNPKQSLKKTEDEFPTL